MLGTVTQELDTGSNARSFRSLVVDTIQYNTV